MEIDGEPDDMNHIKDKEAMVARKLEQISHNLKVIGRIACRIDDSLYCLKHCSRSLEEKVNTVSNVRNQDAMAFDDKSGDALAALIESLDHFDKRKESTAQSILERLESLCSSATLDSTISDLSAVSSNMTDFAASVTSTSQHRLLVEGMRDLNETFENITSIAQQATGASTARSNRPSTHSADISEYFLPRQSATRLSSSGRVVKGMYNDGSSDESDFDIDKGKGKGRGGRRGKEEDQDYWHEFDGAAGNLPSKKTTSIDTQLSTIVQSEDAEFEDDHFSKQLAAANKKRTSSAKGKIKYTASQDEPDGMVVLDVCSPELAAVKPRAPTVSAWAHVRSVHNEAGSKALAPPTVPEISPNGGSSRGTSPLEENVIDLDDSNEARAVTERESPQPPLVPPIAETHPQQQRRRHEHGRSGQNGSEGEEEEEVEEEEEEMVVEEAEQAAGQETQEMMETTTQPQVGQDSGEGQDDDDDTQDTYDMREDNAWRAETNPHQGQYFHDSAEEDEEDGDIREPTPYLPSSSQPDSQGHGSHTFASPQTSEGDSDGYDSESVVCQTKNTPAVATTNISAIALHAPSGTLPDHATFSTGVGSPGGPRRRGEKNMPNPFPGETGPPHTHTSRTHIQESKLSSPSATPLTEHSDPDHHRHRHSHGGSGAAVKAKPIVHSEPSWPSAHLDEEEGLLRHQQAPHAPHQVQEQVMPSEQRSSSAGTGTQSPTESDEEEDSYLVNTYKKGHIGTPAAFGVADAFSQFAFQEPHEPQKPPHTSPMGKRSREVGEGQADTERGSHKTTKRDSDESPPAEPAALPRSHRSKHQGHRERHSAKIQCSKAEVVDLT